MKFDVITFGSATWDIALTFPSVKIKKETDLIVDEGILFNIGSKIDVCNIDMNFGGGGINSATTFANRGCKVAYCGAIGDDIGGREIGNYLKKKKIRDCFIQRIVDKKTNTSVVLKVPQKDRTILVYRGASDYFDKNSLEWEKLKAKWFYLAPLSGNLSHLTEEILLHAKSHNIKTAINLGSKQLSFPKSKLKWILQVTDMVLINLEEASVLTGLNYNDLDEIILKISKMRSGLTVITRGSEGSVVIKDGSVMMASMKKVKPVDNTGAGDAFGSGFISSLLERENDIERAVKVAMLNARSCLSLPGSVNGLLEGDIEKIIRSEKFEIG